MIEETKSKVWGDQYQTMVKVNGEMIRLYWSIGKELNEQVKYGNAFIDILAKEIKLDSSNVKGFSARNLWYMKKFAKEITNMNFLQTVSAKLKYQISLERGIRMGQVNLYKIDTGKKLEFLDKLEDKFEFLGEQDYCSTNDEDIVYTVGTYVSIPEKRKALEWQWILDEYEYGKKETIASPRAVLVIENVDGMYAVTYGLSYFAVDKFCDIEFAFDFARRKEFKQIKTTTLTAPNAQRNKMINVYLNYNDISFDSGESYAKIKAKVRNDEGFVVHSDMMEIGHSIKTQVPENSIDSILRFIEYVEEVRHKEELHKIPVFRKVKDEKIIYELDESLLEKIDENIECINISELDIIGATEVFNNNDATFTLKYKSCKKQIDELTKENIMQFMEENNLRIKDDFLRIKVISNKNGEPVCTEEMKNLIDYTDDVRRCLLLKGEWYLFNDDYVQYLQDSIAEIEVLYNPQYDFSDKKWEEYVEKKYQQEKDTQEYDGLSDIEVRKKNKDKYYPERVYNNVLSEEFGFENHDRSNKITAAGKIELMDLYKDKAMCAVKIGNSSAKLSYVVEQSISSVKMYKHKLLPNMPEIDKVVIWIVLRNHRHLPMKENRPDISILGMVMLKNRLDAWKKEVRLLGYKPIIYINYWENEN